SHTHPLTHSPTHPLTHSPTHSLIHSLTHSLTHSIVPPTCSYPTHAHRCTVLPANCWQIDLFCGSTMLSLTAYHPVVFRINMQFCIMCLFNLPQVQEQCSHRRQGSP